MQQASSSGKSISLANSGKHVPREIKKLSACIGCKLVLTDGQWDKMKECPNCHIETPEFTTDFSGLISIMMPKESWVAKYNQTRKNVPGVYAISVPNFTERDSQGGDQIMNDYGEDDDNSFIDDENE